MTIAVAAVFPRGQVLSILAALPGAIVDQGIVFASDSRFSWGNDPMHEDYGRKVHRLARNAAAVFAGDVLGGQAVIDALRTFGLERQPNAGGVDPGELQRVAKEAWKARENPRGVGQFLVGIVSPQGYPLILRLTSKADFWPLVLPGVQVIGVEEAGAAFRQHLDAIDNDEAQKGKFALKPLDWNGRVVAALDAALRQPGMSGQVGGRIQTIVVTKDGTIEPEIWTLRLDQDPTDPRSLNQITLRTSDARRYAKKRLPS